MKRIFCLKEGRNEWSHTVVVFREDCLEDSEVKLTHFKDDFVKNLDIFFVGGVF